MRRVLIIGATSAIAEATARCFATAGDVLFLVGRDEARLRRIAADLDVRGAVRVAFTTLDVADIDAHAAVLERAERELGGFDTVLVAHGTLADQAECERSVGTLRREFEINALATMALLTPIANQLAAQRQGTIAVIGSVAGDRGRASNYVYGAAKAAVAAFLSGLGQRLEKDCVNVLTIKPGFVDTPMTRDFAKNALWTTPERVAEDIVRAIERRRAVAYVPGFWRAIMFVIRHLPEAMFRRLRL